MFWEHIVYVVGYNDINASVLSRVMEDRNTIEVLTVKAYNILQVSK